MGEDWVYLALLGLIMAILSFVMDKGIAMCTNGGFAKKLCILTFCLLRILKGSSTPPPQPQPGSGCIET